MEDDPEADDPVPEKRRAPLDRYKDFEPSSVTISPDGGIAAGFVGEAPAVPNATPDNMICLRGPCRHYFELETFIASGNTKSTWDPETGLKDPLTGEPVRMPRQTTRSCTAELGIETDLTDDCVYACNRWSPLTPRELKAEAKRREKYLKIHPEHRGR